MSQTLSSNDSLQALQDLPLYQAACIALTTLEDAGYEGYLVGGFVRDALLGRAIHDADLACNAP